MHIGGVNRLDKSATGIHWHVTQMNRIEYIATDDKRQVIPVRQARPTARAT